MFKGQFECLGEKPKKYTTFSFSTEKEIRKLNKDGNEYIMTISYKIKLSIVQDLWQVQYHILSIISQKEFIKLNAKIPTVFLN